MFYPGPYSLTLQCRRNAVISGFTSCSYILKSSDLECFEGQVSIFTPDLHKMRLYFSTAALSQFSIRHCQATVPRIKNSHMTA